MNTKLTIKGQNTDITGIKVTVCKPSRRGKGGITARNKRGLMPKAVAEAQAA